MNFQVCELVAIDLN